MSVQTGMNQGAQGNIAGEGDTPTKNVSPDIPGGLVPDNQLRENLLTPVTNDECKRPEMRLRGVYGLVQKEFNKSLVNGFQTSVDPGYRGYYDHVVPVRGPKPVQKQVDLKQEVINENASRFKWGYQEVPPNYGNNLRGVGALRTMNGTSGKTIRPLLAGGDTRDSGYGSSGFRQAGYKVNGKIGDGI
jgi:hypothetical protein